MVKSVRELLLQNLMQYDWILLALCLVMVILLCFLLFYSRKVTILLRHGGTDIADISDGQDSPDSSLQMRMLQDKEAFFYTLFQNSINLFLLIGIFGTVIAMLRMFSTQESLAVAACYGTLTSTLWGLAFTVLFRALDGFFSARVASHERQVTFCLQQMNADISENPDAAHAESDKPDTQTVSEAVNPDNPDKPETTPGTEAAPASQERTHENQTESSKS